MNQKRKKLLIDALKSGKYEKGKRRLRSTRNRFCCLGVACDIYMKETGLGMWVSPKSKGLGTEVITNKDANAFCSPKSNNCAYLPNDVEDWFGLTTAQSFELIGVNDENGSFKPVIEALKKM